MAAAAAAIFVDGDEARVGRRGNYKLVGLHHASLSSAHIASGALAPHHRIMGIQWWNGPPGPFQNNLLIPCGVRGEGREGGRGAMGVLNLGVTGQERKPPSPDYPSTTSYNPTRDGTLHPLSKTATYPQAPKGENQ